jgi:glycosyltransferase involved in cell wall biosynthesis
VSGRVPANLEEEVARGRRPRADYRAIAEVTDADVVDVGRALGELGALGRMLHRVGGAGLLLAAYAFRHRREYEVVLTDGEQVGIPLAALTRVFGRRGIRHAMIVHVLSVPKKVRLIRSARLAGQIDCYISYCTAQSSFIHNALGVPESRIAQTPFMVDTQFFDTARVGATRRRMICSAGLERRDYPTLMEAVDGLDVDVVIAAASPWSKQHDSSSGRPLPQNVEIRRLSLFELRELYAEAAFVVMPLVEVDFQAGITTILEAMSMGHPVVCTRTPGQTDTIVDGETGVYVPPGDATAMHDAIVRLLDDQREVYRLGRNARDWAVAHADIDVYANAIGAIVDVVRNAPNGVS